jgi:hypothetical protein
MDRLGWSTDRRTKPLMEDTMREMLREGTHGIRSRGLALELTTYVKLSDGSHGPDAEAFSDRLMAYMQAQRLRVEVPCGRRRRRRALVADPHDPGRWGMSLRSCPRPREAVVLVLRLRRRLRRQKMGRTYQEHVADCASDNEDAARDELPREGAAPLRPARLGRR